MPDTRPVVSIRHASPEDAPSIHTCLAAAFEPYRHRYTPGGFRDTVPTAQELEQRVRRMQVLVAVTDFGEVVGTLAYQKMDSEEGHLRGMAVVPSLQGTGIAQQLLGRAESSLRQLDCTRVTLDTTEPLQRATGFYERQGYVATGVVGDFFGMPLLEYAKSLG